MPKKLKNSLQQLGPLCSLTIKNTSNFRKFESIVPLNLRSEKKICVLSLVLSSFPYNSEENIRYIRE